jgi:hypothetical protein
MHCGHFLVYTTRALCQTPAETPSSEAGKTWREMSFAGEVSRSYFAGIFNTPYKFATWGRRLYFPSEIVLRICIALKIHHPRQGLNPQSLGSMVSTTTTGPSRTTGFYLILDLYINYIHTFIMPTSYDLKLTLRPPQPVTLEPQQFKEK